MFLESTLSKRDFGRKTAIFFTNSLTSSNNFSTFLTSFFFIPKIGIKTYKIYAIYNISLWDQKCKVAVNMAKIHLALVL